MNESLVDAIKAPREPDSHTGDLWRLALTSCLRSSRNRRLMARRIADLRKSLGRDFQTFMPPNTTKLLARYGVEHAAALHLLERRLEHLFAETHRVSQRNGALLARIGADFAHETPLLSLVHADFVDRLHVLKNGAPVDLQASAPFVRLAAAMMRAKASGARQNLTRAAQVWGYLRPIPEVFWRVDRDTEAYNARLGIDLIDAIATSGAGIVLELGAGSGVCASRRCRSTRLQGRIAEFSISDTIYFSVAQLIDRLIDQAGVMAQLRVHDRSVAASFVDFIYKTLYLKPGDGDTDTPEYDKVVIRNLTRDLNVLPRLLQQLGSKLRIRRYVPSEFGVQPDQHEVAQYPNRIDRFSDPRLARLLATYEGNAASLLMTRPADGMLYDWLEVFPVGVMASQFGAINRICESQVRFVVSVRGTVYAAPRKYSDLLCGIARTLDSEGICIDDGVRENFGKVYRLPEVMEAVCRLRRGAATTAATEAALVVGPGVPGDDYNQQDAVRAVVLAKRLVSLDKIRSTLLPRFRLLRLEDIMQDDQYLRSLDPGGTHWAAVRAARRSLAWSH